MPFSVRRALTKVAVNLAVLLVGVGISLGVAEMLVRLVAPQQLVAVRPDIWIPDDTVGWRVRGNVNATINTGERAVHFVSDSAGFRADATGGRPRGDVNILLIGDSFVQALQVDYAATTGAVLEQQLSKTLGKRVTVWNAGVNGWDPDQYLIRTRQLLDRASYDAVLVSVYVDNDVIREQRLIVPARAPAEVHQFRMPHGVSHGELVASFFYPLNDFLKMRSHLFLLMKHAFDTVLLSLGLAEPDFPIVVQRRIANDPRWDLTARVCGDLAAEAKRHGTPTIFGIVPAPYQVDSAAFEYYRRGFKLEAAATDINQPQHLLDSALASRGLNVVDVLPVFRKRNDREHQLYGKVDRHFTPLGHMLFADQVAPVLQSALTSRASHR